MKRTGHNLYRDQPTAKPRSSLKVLEEGDVESAKALYLRSSQIKKTPGDRKHSRF